MCLPCTFWRTEANSHHTFDVTIWLSRTTDNSNIFIRSREVRDNESRLYIENFTPKKEKKKLIKNSDIFHISAENIDCGYSLDYLGEAFLMSTHILIFLAK